ISLSLSFFLSSSLDHRDLHSFPTRRSSDLNCDRTDAGRYRRTNHGQAAGAGVNREYRNRVGALARSKKKGLAWVRLQITRPRAGSRWRCADQGQPSGGWIGLERRNAVQVVVGNKGKAPWRHLQTHLGLGSSTAKQNSDDKQGRD